MTLYSGDVGDDGVVRDDDVHREPWENEGKSWQAEFGVGWFTGDDLIAAGGKHDQGSALVVKGKDCLVTLYADPNFDGDWSVTFPEGNYPIWRFIMQGAANNEVSSLKVCQGA